MSLFSNVAGMKTPRSKFNLSHERKLSMQMGFMYPILNEEIVPGDKFRVRSEVMMRLAPMIAPIMHRVDVWCHYFFVPNRLVWEDWETFITGGDDGLQTATWPHVSLSDTNKSYFAKSRLPDYMGIPPIDPADTVTNDRSISILPFRAYALIYNEYFRDQNVDTPIDFGVDSGLETNTTIINDLTLVRPRRWQKDYFTSCLPWAQKGAEAILPSDITYDNTPLVRNDGNPIASSGSLDYSGVGAVLGQGADVAGLTIENIESLGISVNDLRSSVRLQEWLERNARAGSRYVEQILSHFGVQSPDYRLQRPEYLGGGKTPISVSEVLNTAGLTENAGVDLSGGGVTGQMSGHGLSVGNINAFSKKFTEHGHVIGIMSVLPKTAYQQGIHKSWRRVDKLDYYFPEFANLGEQDVELGELYHDYTGTSGDSDATFGYQSRYAEMKHRIDTVHGDFRDDIDFWHLGRKFATAPSLNSTFLKAATGFDRIFAVQDGSDNIYCQVYNKVDALRPMPYMGTPKL